MEFIPNREIEIKEKRKYLYDAVFILCGGIKPKEMKDGTRYVPIDFISSKDLHQNGGSVRSLAAIELYLNQQAKNFVFSGGRGPGNVARYGDNIPSESSVYRNQFTHTLDGLKKRSDYVTRLQDLEAIEVGDEDKSFDTETNIKEILRIIHKTGFKTVALVSSRFHMERVRVLCDEILKMQPQLDGKIKFVFLSAEDVIEKY